ncbi:MAG: methylmalonyl-CoA mutase family protein [Candidatus Hydrogenedentota bacterium]
MTKVAKSRKQEFQTISGIPISAHYGPEADRPGDFPFTRGIRPSMYRGQFWTMRQYAGMGDAEESNRRYKYLLSEGQTGLSIAFDLPTQIGFDSDDPLAEGEVGKVGVATDSLADMELLLDGIPLDKVTTSMTINATASILLALYIAVGEKQGVPRALLGGTTQNDILKEYIARGTYAFPPKPSLRIITDMFEFCSKEMPRWNTISISGYHIREAGSTAVEEVAFTIADAIAYVDVAVRRGLDVDDFAGRLSFFFNCHMDFFEEVAKFRAARRIWAKVMRDRFHAKDARSGQMRFHTQTAGSSLQAEQIDVNIVRTTIEAMAAVCGGTQSLHTNSRDEALALPTEASARIALRTQQVIAHESGIADVVDPLGGSHYVEALTDEIENRAMELIGRIDGMGGMLKAIESGFPQRAIRDSAFRYQAAVESGDRKIVGVNCFRIEEPPPVLFQHDPAIASRQKERLLKVRNTRDASRVHAALQSVESAARGTDNLMPVILDAVKSFATVGEIVSAMKRVFGAYSG